jgi:AcrR family transcriptional regulator
VASETGVLSPNQLARRQQIITAAQQVILRGGPAQCTTREVARESGLNQGLIYYYFDSIEAIVDEAMQAFADELATAITKTNEAHHSPDGYHALVQNYLQLFKDRPGLHMAWFEYYLISTRAGRADKLLAIHDNVVALLTDALEAIGIDDAGVQARVAVSYILGVLVRSWAIPQILDNLDPEIATLARDR